MRSSMLVRLLTRANPYGMARRVTKRLIDRGEEAALTNEIREPDNMSLVYYDLMLPNNQVSDDVRDALIDRFEKCPECGNEPVMDRDAHPGAHTNHAYCSDKCLHEARDGENDRQCELCDDWYNDEQEGGYMMDRSVCSEHCAWEALEYDRWHVEKFFKQHPLVDRDLTLEALKKKDWFHGDTDDIMALLEESAVIPHHCDACGEPIAEEDEARYVTDLGGDGEEDAGWFCSDQHCWVGIAEWLSDRTGRHWSDYETQQAFHKRNYVLWELEEPEGLNRAIRELGV